MENRAKTLNENKICPNCTKYYAYYYLWCLVSKFFRNQFYKCYNCAEFKEIFFRILKLARYLVYLRAVSRADEFETKSIRRDSLAGGDIDNQESNRLVQIMKKTMPEESADSDYSNVTEFNENSGAKPKKSIFASLMKRKKGKNRDNTLNGFSGFTFDGETISSEYRTESDPSSESKSRNYGLITKFIRNSRSLSDHNLNSLNPRFDTSRLFGDSSIPEEYSEGLSNNKTFSYVHNFIATTYVPKYDLKLINGISELQDILQKLHTSEEHMILILKKYVSDKNFQKQLMDTTFQYFSSQHECKSQATALSNGMWIQQLEISKMQERNMQKKLNFLVKQNRLLHIDIENLCRHYEKLADKSNFYPKRFLQMRSFGKTYAKHLIDNNRKLQSKVKSLTDVIEGFENEMNKLQEQNESLDSEKRNMKSQIYHLEAHLHKNVTTYEVEISSLTFQCNTKNQIIKDSEQGGRFLLQDLNSFERQVRDMSIILNWPKLQYQEACLPELIYHIRTCVEEMATGLITSYTTVTTQIKDVNKLRDTNARLQENLQKSTSELDNLSKKLEQNKDTSDTTNGLEVKFNSLEQDIVDLKAKLEIANEKNSVLKQELEYKNRSLNESGEAINNLSAEKNSLRTQINDFVKVISHCGIGDVPKDFEHSQEKLEYFKAQYIKAVTDFKYTREKCQKLSEENQSLLENQQIVTQEIEIVQDGLNSLSTENDLLRKQLSTEKQTVASLQNERIKYLEEKNILRAIFQQLKSEISRMQQLEGTVSDMSKENSRLTLVAEFNKQLGEQLKSEVEVKENTILELRQNLEKLSHLQLDNDREKLTLCAQLSEISNVKEKLSDCLEQEARKYTELDETKRRLENNTKSQLKIFEEMQKNERQALKELLKDFKGVVKQRDALLKLEEENKKTRLELEAQYKELKTQYDSTLVLMNEKDTELRHVYDKLKEQENLIRKWEEKNVHNNSKYEKAVRKLDKLIGDLRRDKEELEESNNYLKTNIQRMHNDLNAARKTEKEISTQLAAKAAECSAIEVELVKYKEDCQKLNHDNGKLKVEVDFLRQINEKQNNDLQNTLTQSSSKDNKYQETLNTMLSKQYEIEHLNMNVVERDERIKRLEMEFAMLKKQNDDLNKILCGYEDQLVVLSETEKVKNSIEKEFERLRIEHENTREELKLAKKEIDKLNYEIGRTLNDCERDKAYYKSQTEELIVECTAQKENIENEIGSISLQLEDVNHTLHQEKSRFDSLFEAHEDLKVKYMKIKENLSSEISAHKETCRKTADLENLLKSVELERDNLQRQIHLVLVELNDEKEAYAGLSKENQRLEMVLEQGRQQYGTLVARCIVLENQLADARMQMDDQNRSRKQSDSDIHRTITLLEEKNRELEEARSNIEALQIEIEDNQKLIFDLKEEVFKMQQEVTSLDFKNCELTLQFHETQGKLETERALYRELKTENERTLEKLERFENYEESVTPSQDGESYY